MRQRDAGERVAHQVLDVIRGTDLGEKRPLANEFGFAHLGGNGEIHARVAQVLVLIERRAVDEGLNQLERQGYEVAWHHCLEQAADLLVEVVETGRQVVVVVGGKIAGMNLERERGERAGEGEHRLVEPGWVPVAGFEDVLDQREMGVDGIEKPETRDIGGAEIGETQVLHPPRAAEHETLGREDLHQAPGDFVEPFARADIEQRRNAFGIEAERAGGRLEHARHADRGKALPRFAFGEQAEILARHHHRLLAESGILVAQHRGLGLVARVDIAGLKGNVDAGQLLMRDGEIDVARLLIGIEEIEQRLFRRRRIGIRDIEEESVREDAGRLRERQVAAGQFLAIEAELLETPRAKI